MAKKNLNNAFITTRIKNDDEIKKATSKNINRINEYDIEEIHKNLIKTLNIKNESETNYFLLEKFKELINEIKNEKKINNEYKEYKYKNGKNALSKKEWFKKIKNQL
ncbi:hypothetical protein ACBT_0188 [Aliarcobacter cibarius]|uniref:Uncharacterized protein n=1 Tax=Aliarcobacter cibarius TaxID=255507 RepID=A0A7L5JLY2_9BACT|nr:hypothetical protein [Aliarcobacter cibarius]QKJ26172.1 hypothetical protein ACBT_0188 [Aliarcobacter cibarius]